MIEILRTNDPVALSFAEALLKGEGIAAVVFDSHMSVLEGSIPVLQRRLMVADEDGRAARALLEEAGIV